MFFANPTYVTLMYPFFFLLMTIANTGVPPTPLQMYDEMTKLGLLFPTDAQRDSQAFDLIIFKGLEFIQNGGVKSLILIRMHFHDLLLDLFGCHKSILHKVVKDSLSNISIGVNACKPNVWQQLVSTCAAMLKLLSKRQSKSWEWTCGEVTDTVNTMNTLCHGIPTMCPSSHLKIPPNDFQQQMEHFLPMETLKPLPGYWPPFNTYPNVSKSKSLDKLFAKHDSTVNVTINTLKLLAEENLAKLMEYTGLKDQLKQLHNHSNLVASDIISTVQRKLTDMEPAFKKAKQNLDILNKLDKLDKLNKMKA